MNQAIRWGIWGTGHIANKVASDFEHAGGAIVHAVASRSGERARLFAAQVGAARWHEGLDALLRDKEVEVVYVATPHHLHLDDCLACIEAGKAVLCEKPFALNEGQARRMVDAARSRGVFCMEAMWTRFLPAVVEAKRLVASGELGSVRMVQGNFAHPATEAPESRLFSLGRGGGALLDIGVYVISLAQHLLGAPEAVRGTAIMGATGVDVQSAYQLAFPCGAIADVAASLQVLGNNEFVVLGKSGLLRLCEPFYAAQRLEFEAHDNRRVVERSVKTLPFAGHGYQFELMEVNRCIREGSTESAIMSWNDTLEVMGTMDALRAQFGLVYPQEQTARG